MSLKSECFLLCYFETKYTSPSYCIPNNINLSTFTSLFRLVTFNLSILSTLYTYSPIHHQDRITSELDIYFNSFAVLILSQTITVKQHIFFLEKPQTYIFLFKVHAHIV